MYKVSTQQFSGPIEKLLELIEEKKLEITQVNLALVTDDFLKYLEILKNKKLILKNEENAISENSDEELRLLADFLVVASRLMLIKSKSLLPSLELTAEEERDIHDLEKRLLLYKQFKPAMVLLKNLYEQKNCSFSRPLFLGRPSIFYPSKEATAENLYKSMRGLMSSLEQLSIEFQTIEISLIRLEEKIEEIIKKIESGIENFGGLIKEKSKKEIVVMFLALLHLLKEQRVRVNQKERFSEIMIEKNS